MRAILTALFVALAAFSTAADARAPVTFPKLSYPYRPTLRQATTPPTSAPPAERIDDFSSDITIEKDGGLMVRETIKVRANGRAIRHGIFRDFPTRYRDKLGNETNVRFSVRDVQRDGHAEPYTVESIKNGKRVRIGDADVDIPRDQHIYLIVYRTDRQIGFFSKFDELYWNVTGNAWAFPIQHAEAIVHLPESAQIAAHAEYTGLQGERGGHASAESQGRRVRFFSTAVLDVREGLTFALDFTKGAVMPPSSFQTAEYFLRDNAMLSSAFLGLFALTLYFGIAWWNFGRDPAQGVVIPLFAPPRNLSPASIRFIRRMDYDRKCFAAALVSMAVKGYLRIADEAGTYILARTRGSNAKLAASEAAIAHALFRSDDDRITLESKNADAISRAIDGLKSALRREDEGTYFNANRNLFLGGLGILITSIVAAVWYAVESGTGFGFGVTVVALILALAGWLFLSGESWRSVWAKIDARILVGIPLLGFAAFQIVSITNTTSVWEMIAGDFPVATIAALFGEAVLAVCFYYLLKQPTLAGAKIRNEIDGFRMFLNAAEKDRLEKLQPPQLTPEIFEKYLPFAIALDAENAWSRKFEAEAEAAGVDTSPTYAPLWYSGRSLSNFSRGGFTSSLGSSIASATASASAAPGSTIGGGFSGGGGGGFSGGGGGGGGGGGW